jgi:SNF2 family DNA or RNA helicase
MDFKIKPYQHQMDALALSKSKNDLALFWEMGTGKTGGMINILRDKYYSNGGIMRTLIFSPPVTLHNWANEFGIHSNIPDDSIVVLDKNGKARINQCKKFIGLNKIVIVNYESLRSKQLFSIFDEWEPELLVMDESHKLKNPSSLQSKCVVKLAKHAKHRFILTGTPILNNAMDIFNQYKALDLGATFGDNFIKFRSRYFKDANAHMPRHVHFPKWEPIKERYNELSSLIYSKATRVKKEDCLDLPPLIKETRYIPMSKPQARVYKEMRDTYVASIESDRNSSTPSFVVANNALTKLLRLQQIVSGHVKTEDGYIITIKENPRLEYTKELLQELTPNHKVIVWTAFREDVEQLKKVCEELNIKYETLTGAQNAREKRESMESFRRSSDVRVIIANRVAGGIGVNLVEASYSIVYSRDFSLDAELQSEARNHRGGSEMHKQIVKIDLCARGSIDELVLHALRAKQSVSEKIIDLVEKI